MVLITAWAKGADGLNCQLQNPNVHLFEDAPEGWDTYVLTLRRDSLPSQPAY